MSNHHERERAATDEKGTADLPPLVPPAGGGPERGGISRFRNSDSAERVGAAIARNTTLLLVVTVAFKVLGFLEKVLLARQFGTGPEVEAYLIAFSVPFGLAIVLRDLLEPTLLPVFMRLSGRADRRAWRLAALIATVLGCGLIVVVILGSGTASGLVHLLAPGFGAERNALTVRLLRLLMPALLFLGLANVTSTLLHAEKRFVLPAFGEVVFRGGPVAGLLAGAGLPGLIGGVLIGAFGKLLVQLTGLRRAWPALVRGLGHWEDEAKTVGYLAAPLSVGLLLAYVAAPAVENAFASTMTGGSVAALAFARKIVETLGSILPYTLGIVAFPYFAQLRLGDDDAALRSTLYQLLRVILFFFMPASLGLILLRVPIVQLLFQRGAFGAAATQQTAWPLLFYALGLVPMAIEPALVHFYFAQHDTVTPVVWDIISFVVGVVLIVALLGPLGAGGIALAASLAKTVKVTALTHLVTRKLPQWRPTALAAPILRLAAACLGMGIVVFALSNWFAASNVNGGGGAFIHLMVATIAGGVTFLSIGWLLRVEEMQLVPVLWQRLRVRIRRLPG